MSKIEELENAEKILRDAAIYLEQYSDSSKYTNLKKLVEYMDDAVYFLNAEIKGIPLNKIPISKPLLPIIS